LTSTRCRHSILNFKLGVSQDFLSQLWLLVGLFLIVRIHLLLKWSQQVLYPDPEN
jgi:hypothetical protein